MADAYLTVPEVAAAMRVHRQTVYRMVWSGELPWVNVGRGKSRPRIRIRQSAVDAFMSSRERGAAA